MNTAMTLSLALLGVQACFDAAQVNIWIPYPGKAGETRQNAMKFAVDDEWNAFCAKRTENPIATLRKPDVWANLSWHATFARRRAGGGPP